MSKMIKLDVTQACNEGLACSGYLPFRTLTVENVLSKAIFPCRYKQFECTANAQFNKILKHEEGCIHRPFPCASLPYTNCSWKGSVSQVTGHFAEKHSNFVQQEAKIQFCVDQYKEGVLLVNENLESFIVKYAFNSTIASLRYQLRLCMVGVDSQDCNVQLSNDFYPDYSVHLKTKCFAYNTDLCNDNLLNVDMKSILAVLNNPKSFTVVFHVKLPTPLADSSPNNEVVLSKTL